MYLSKNPIIILLSGWYWFSNELNFNGVKIRKVQDGFLAQSYIINRAAASILIDLKPGVVADDWIFYKSLGIKIYGVSPRIFDQRWSKESPSTINYDNKMIKGHPLKKILIYSKELRRKFGKLIGHFESCDYFEKK